VPIKSTSRRLLWKTRRTHKLRPFDKNFAHQIGLNNLGATTKTNNSVLKIKIKGGPRNRMLAKTPTGTDRSAFFAKCRATDRRNAAKGCRLTNRASTPTDDHFGPRLTPRMASQPTTWTSLLSRSRIFSDELDGTPTSSSSRHSTTDFKFMCHFHRDIQ